jgi:O-antigen biosynthesis protein
MVTDREAEHIPGCNMAFYKRVLTAVGGFDPVFHLAGDDVDICWRLQQAGHRIGFSPAAFVWHYRRSTVADYLRQQRGYGEAEALLVRKHPECFNSLGGNTWRGRIYAASRPALQVRRPVIYRGAFGSAGFQSLYAAEPALNFMVCTALEYHLLVTLPLWVLSATFHLLLPLAVTSLVLSVGVGVAAGAQAVLPRTKIRWWSRPLVSLLFLLQPIVRGWARYQGRLALPPAPSGLSPQQTLDSVALRESRQSLSQVTYSANAPINRLEWAADLARRLDQQGWPNKTDAGWSEYDVEIYGSRWTNLQLITVEEYPAGKQLIRCRLRPRWPLQAKGFFWSLGGLELLLLGLFAPAHPWWWLLLLTLPLFAWFIHRDHRKLQSMILVFLDQAAKERNLTKVQAREPENAGGPPP